MADTTYAVKITEELKDKLQHLIDKSGHSSKDFFAEMISQFELAGIKKKTPMLAADIDEMMSLTTRINNLFVNIGERINSMEESHRLQLAQKAKDKDALIGLLRQQLDDLRGEATQTDEQIQALLSENMELKASAATFKEAHRAEADQLKEINRKNDNLMTGHMEKIDMLTGLVNEYKPYADENAALRQALHETQKTAEDTLQENEKISRELLALRQEMARELEQQKIRIELERDRLLLEQRTQHNTEVESIRELYQNKINQLLHLK